MSELPSHIGPFEVRERLGTGGMGVVYLAYDPPLDRLVAVKVLNVDDEEVRQRFLREARFAARVQHPNIVAIYAVGEHQGRPYMAMEYIAGETLSSIIRGGAPVPMGRRIQWLYELASGLEYAHRNGIVHRDVKPANLMVSRDSGLLRLLDFGIARDDDSEHTMAGHIIGTPSYMSPEQVTGGTVDARSDIFAFGLVAYELLSGTRAFQGKTSFETTRLIVEADPESLAVRAPGLPSSLVETIHRCLAKSPEDRPSSLVPVRADLRRVLHRFEPVDEPSVVRTALRPSATATLTPTTSSGDREQRRLRRRQQIQSLVAKARQALEAGDFEAAVEAAEQADLFDDRTPELSLLLTDIQAERQRRDATSRLGQVRTQIESGDLSGADAAISSLEAEGLVTNEQLRPLRDAVAAARLDQRVDRCMRDLWALLRSRDPHAAARRLQAESTEVRGHPRLEELSRMVESARLEAERILEQRRLEAEARRRAEEEARRQAQEEARRKAEEEARRRAEEEARRQAEEEARRRAEQEARRKAEEEARRLAEEEARRKAEEEARRRAEEEARRRAEEEARRQAEEAARRKAEEEARRKAEEDARRRAEEEAAHRKAEEEARRQAEEDEARRKAEREARRKAEDEEARRVADEEARRKARDEEERRRDASAPTVVVPIYVPPASPGAPRPPAPAPPRPRAAPAVARTAASPAPVRPPLAVPTPHPERPAPEPAAPGHTFPVPTPVVTLAVGLAVLLVLLAGFWWLSSGPEAPNPTTGDARTSTSTPVPPVADTTAQPADPATTGASDPAPAPQPDATDRGPGEAGAVTAVTETTREPAGEPAPPAVRPIAPDIRQLVASGRADDAVVRWRQHAEAPDREAALAVIVEHFSAASVRAKSAAVARGARGSDAFLEGEAAETRAAQLARARSIDAAAQYRQATAAFDRAQAPRPATPTSGTPTSTPAGTSRDDARPAEAPTASLPTKSGSTSAGAADHQPAVLAVLDAFAAAYNRRDLDGIAALWPSMPGEWRTSLTNSFRTFSSVDWTYTSRAIEVSGDSAQARIAVAVRSSGSRGTFNSSRNYLVDLRRQGGRWTIASMTLQ